MENKIEDNLDDILAKLLGNEKLDEEEKKRAVLSRETIARAILRQSGSDHLIIKAIEDVNSDIHYIVNHELPTNSSIFYRLQQTLGLISNQDVKKLFYHRYLAITQQAYSRKVLFINLASFNPLGGWSWGTMIGENKIGKFTTPDTKPKNIAISLMACEAASGKNKSSSFSYKLANELSTKKYSFYIKADTKIQNLFGTFSFGHCKKIFIPHNGEILVEDLTTYLPYQTYKMIVKIYNEKTNNEIKKMLYPILDLIEGNNFVLTTNDKTAIVSILNDVLVASKNSNDTNSFFYKNNDKILQQYITQLIRNFKPETTETSLHSSRVIHI